MKILTCFTVIVYLLRVGLALQLEDYVTSNGNVSVDVGSTAKLVWTLHVTDYTASIQRLSDSRLYNVTKRSNGVNEEIVLTIINTSLDDSGVYRCKLHLIDIFYDDIYLTVSEHADVQTPKEQTPEKQRPKVQIPENQKPEKQPSGGITPTQEMSKEQTTSHQIIDQQKTNGQMLGQQTTNHQVLEHQTTNQHIPEQKTTKQLILEQQTTNHQIPEPQTTYQQIPEQQTTKQQILEQQTTNQQIPDDQAHVKVPLGAIIALIGLFLVFVVILLLIVIRKYYLQYCSTTSSATSSSNVYCEPYEIGNPESLTEPNILNLNLSDTENPSDDIRVQGPPRVTGTHYPNLAQNKEHTAQNKEHTPTPKMCLPQGLEVGDDEGLVKTVQLTTISTVTQSVSYRKTAERPAIHNQATDFIPETIDTGFQAPIDKHILNDDSCETCLDSKRRPADDESDPSQLHVDKSHSTKLRSTEFGVQTPIYGTTIIEDALERLRDPTHRKAQYVSNAPESSKPCADKSPTKHRSLKITPKSEIDMTRAQRTRQKFDGQSLGEIPETDNEMYDRPTYHEIRDAHLEVDNTRSTGYQGSEGRGVGSVGSQTEGDQPYYLTPVHIPETDNEMYDRLRYNEIRDKHLEVDNTRSTGYQGSEGRGVGSVGSRTEGDQPYYLTPVHIPETANDMYGIPRYNEIRDKHLEVNNTRSTRYQGYEGWGVGSVGSDNDKTRPPVCSQTEGDQPYYLTPVHIKYDHL